eukprot:g28355.t1
MVIKDEKIAKLVTEKPYDEAILSDLETYLQKQVDNNTYDLEANRHLLKIYMFSPETMKPAVVTQVLVKAMMAIGTTDFLACSFLVPRKLALAEEGPVKTLFALADQLERCDFPAFWKARAGKDASALVNSVNGFDTAIRVFVAATVASTFKRIDSARLKNYLNLEGKEFEAFVGANRGWRLSDAGDVVSFPDMSQADTDLQTIVSLDQIVDMCNRINATHG